LLLALALLVCSVQLVFAQGEGEAVPVTPGFEPIYEVFRAMGYAAPIAVIMGLVTSLLGYLRETPPEEFELAKFLYTALISLIIGIATIYGGWSYAEVQQWLANGCLTLYIYWLAKVIAKKLKWTYPATGPPQPTA